MYILFQSIQIRAEFKLKPCNSSIKKYFELMVQIAATLIPVKFTSNWWNFELTVFELTVHFKHEMIGMWQRFQRNLK